MDKKLKEIINNWLIKAENDLKTAEQTFNAEEIITDTICFHSQQAAEKYLKAYLVSKNIVPDKTHKIEILLTKCMGFHPSFEEIKDSKILSEYAVELRYPDDFYMPSIEEAKEALILAKRVKAFVLERLQTTKSLFNGD